MRIGFAPTAGDLPGLRKIGITFCPFTPHPPGINPACAAENRGPSSLPRTPGAQPTPPKEISVFLPFTPHPGDLPHQQDILVRFFEFASAGRGSATHRSFRSELLNSASNRRGSTQVPKRYIPRTARAPPCTSPESTSQSRCSTPYQQGSSTGSSPSSYPVSQRRSTLPPITEPDPPPRSPGPLNLPRIPKGSPFHQFQQTAGQPDYRPEAGLYQPTRAPRRSLQRQMPRTRGGLPAQRQQSLREGTATPPRQGYTSVNTKSRHGLTDYPADAGFYHTRFPTRPHG